MKNSNLWRVLSWVAILVSTIFLVIRRLGEHVFEWGWTVNCREVLEIVNWVLLAAAIVLLVKAIAIDLLERERRTKARFDALEEKLDELLKK